MGNFPCFEIRVSFPEGNTYKSLCVPIATQETGLTTNTIFATSIDIFGTAYSYISNPEIYIFVKMEDDSSASFAFQASILSVAPRYSLVFISAVGIFPTLPIYLDGRLDIGTDVKIYSDEMAMSELGILRKVFSYDGTILDNAFYQVIPSPRYAINSPMRCLEPYNLCLITYTSPADDIEYAVAIVTENDGENTMIGWPMQAILTIYNNSLTGGIYKPYICSGLLAVLSQSFIASNNPDGTEIQGFYGSTPITITFSSPFNTNKNTYIQFSGKDEIPVFDEISLTYNSIGVLTIMTIVENNYGIISYQQIKTELINNDDNIPYTLLRWNSL